MANKLKNVFSDEMFAVSEKISFSDQDSYEKFLRALDVVYKEGKVQKVEGVTSIVTEARLGNCTYPVGLHDNILNFEVAPAMEKVSFELNTTFGKRSLDFWRYYTERTAVLQTCTDTIVSFKLIIDNNEKKVMFSFHAQPDKAKSVNDILESYSTAIAFLNYSFDSEIITSSSTSDTERESVIKAKHFFEISYRQFEKLQFLEHKLGISFDPKELVSDVESQMDAEELYILLKEKKAIRVNTKSVELNTLDLQIGSKNKQITEGSVLDFTFTSSVEYVLWGRTVILHTANLLTNAVVKEIQKIDAETIKMIYGSEDSRPMFISYKGFQTKAEAEREIDKIMENRLAYAEALTLHEYVAIEEGEYKQVRL